MSHTRFVVSSKLEQYVLFTGTVKRLLVHQTRTEESGKEGLQNNLWDRVRDARASLQPDPMHFEIRPIVMVLTHPCMCS